MAFKRRPDIRLFAPARIAVGRPFFATVVIDCSQPLPVDAIVVECEGRWTLVGEGPSSEAKQFFQADGRPLSSPQELPRGEHRYRVVMELPPDAPSSYRGELFRVDYLLRVRVNIPWWPDARATFDLCVLGRGHATSASQSVYAVDIGTNRQPAPYAEVSLSSNQLVPGQVVVGAIALANTAIFNYRSVTMRLVAVEERLGVLPRMVCVRRVYWGMLLKQLQENESISFSLAIPENLVPAFSVGRIKLTWFLQLVIAIPNRSDLDLWIPVDVVVEPDAVHRLREPLAVGSARLELLWQTAARHSGCEAQGTTLRRRVGDVLVDVRHDYRADRGPIVVGELRFPHLGIDLRAEPTADGTRPHARSANQTKFLVDRLDAQWKSARVVEADDERIICEFPEMGSRLRRLILFVESLTTLADGIESLRDTIPAPQALAEKTGIWEAAAHSLGAMFEPAAMRFTVARESMKVLVRPDWLLGGEANGLVIELHPGIEIASRLRGTWERFEQFESAHGSSGLRAVRIDNSHIRLELPVEATLEDAANRVLALLEIGKRLHGSRGAYR